MNSIIEAQIDMTKLIKILRDIYKHQINENTIKVAQDLENNSEIWRNISVIRYVAGVPMTWKDFESVARDAEELIEDDLNN